MQNLREAILSYRRGLGQEIDEKQRAQQLQRGVEYLERYWTLVAFAAYLHDPAWTASADVEADGSFHRWVTRRPELQSCLSRLLWRNPLAALSSAQTSVPDGDAAAEAVVMSRNGAVLTAHCILKVSQQAPPPVLIPVPLLTSNPALPGRTVPRRAMPLRDDPLAMLTTLAGVHMQSLPVLHAGAPNFRAAQPYPVFGVATATMDGIRAVLDAVGAAAVIGGHTQVTTWFNLREEVGTAGIGQGSRF